MVGDAGLAADEIEEIVLGAADGADSLVVYSNARVQDAPPASYPLPERPLVDGLHQWRDREWPGKARDLDEVRRALEQELAGDEPALPADFSPYGGWKQRRFEASGFFRVEHDGSRFWLVDPEGYAFFSIGVDCISPSNGVEVASVGELFEPPLPDRRVAPHLYSERGTALSFDASVHNLERTLGPRWKERWSSLTRRRLRKYRVNTIANWSDPSLFPFCQVPYVFTMRGFPTTSAKLFRDFPDVYSPEYEVNASAFAQQLEAIRRDPFVVGYFMTNEPQWAFVERFDLGRHLLSTDESSHTRAALIAFLNERYSSIGALNDAWGSTFGAFDELLSRCPMDGLPGSRADTMAFTERAVERFVAVPAAACKRADPNHANLGLRWAWVHSDYQLAGSEHIDVFSINCYELRPDRDRIDRITRVTGRPVCIGEFHVGSLDRGLPSGGIRNARTMAESVKAYRYYLENAAALPNLVGAHYFQWMDQHVLGRFDGENMQIGLHDITHRAYPEWVEICQRVHPEIYRIASGEKKPFSEAPQVTDAGTLCW
jgi:hypothetical protein